MTERLQPSRAGAVSRRLLAAALAAAVLAGAGARPAVAASFPSQRGEFVPPDTVAASVVTLCGLAVMLVVQAHGGKATLYAGDAMQAKLGELDLDTGSRSHELADMYEPILASCDHIRSEHERAMRSQLRD